jgi:phosphoribosylformylglycinamidine synthase
MVSESQERMLCVIEPEKLAELEEICERWEVRATAIGEVTDSRRLRVLDGDEVVGDMPVDALVDDCPLYDLEPAAPAGQIYPAPPQVLDPAADVHETLLALLSSHNLASRRPLFEQYDSIVQSRTVRRPEVADAAVLQLAPDGGEGAIAVSIDGNGRRVACDPYTGTVEAVLECAANLACVGAEPLGLTNCLNFGNPEKPHVAWQLERSVAGMADVLRELGVPVVGGNVSLYNESGDGPIYPTPVVGMVGALPDAAVAPRSGFVREGDVVALVSSGVEPSLPGSELAKLRGDELPLGLPQVDVAGARDTLGTVRSAARGGGLATVHDVSEGGLAVALAESCLGGGLGASASLPDASLTAIFGEGAGRFLVAGERSAVEALGERALEIGTVGGDSLELEGVANWTLSELRDAHGSLAEAFL